MYILIAGGGKIGRNLTKTLVRMGHEVTVIENDPARYALLEEDLEHVAQYGDATEVGVLERCGVGRAGIVVAVTGDDEDNVIVCQLARDRYGVTKTIARVNDPRNQEAFDLLGIGPTVCATTSILALIEHELPDHKLVPLLRLRGQDLEIAEVQVDAGGPAVGKLLRDITLPDGIRLISVMRGSSSEIAVGDTLLEPGDQVLAVLRPGMEGRLREALLSDASGP